MPALYRVKASSVLESDVKAANTTTHCGAARWAYGNAELNHMKRLDCTFIIAWTCTYGL